MWSWKETEEHCHVIKQQATDNNNNNKYNNNNDSNSNNNNKLPTITKVWKKKHGENKSVQMSQVKVMTRTLTTSSLLLPPQFHPHNPVRHICFSWGRGISAPPPPPRVCIDSSGSSDIFSLQNSPEQSQTCIVQVSSNLTQLLPGFYSQH